MEKTQGQNDHTMSDGATEPRGGVIHCDPCENEGRYVLAHGYCTDCDDYLCSKCFKIHRRPVLWRFHELKDRQEMPKMKTMNGLNDECVESCARHSKKVLEYFCQTHDELLCSLCVFRSHRWCDSVFYIPDIAYLIPDSEEMKGLNNRMVEFQKDIAVQRTVAQECLAEVDNIEEKVVKDITTLKTEICKFLDTILEGIRATTNSDRANLVQSDSRLQSVSKRSKTIVTILEKKQKEKKMIQFFVELKLSKLAMDNMLKEVEELKAGQKVHKCGVNIDNGTFIDIWNAFEKIRRTDDPVSSSAQNGNKDMHDRENMGVSEDRNTSPNKDLTEYSHNTSMCQYDGGIVDVTEGIPSKNDEQLNTEQKSSSVETDSLKESAEQETIPQVPRIIRQYDRDFLVKLQTSYYGLRKPVGMLEDPDVVLSEPQELYLRFMKAKTEINHPEVLAAKPEPHCIVAKKKKKKKKNKAQSAEAMAGSMPSIPTAVSEHMRENGQITETAATYTVDRMTGNVTAHVDEELPYDMTQKLYSLIVVEKQEEQRIIEWIESSLDVKQKSLAQFIQILIRSVCRFSCETDDRWLFHPTKIHERKCLLKKYISNNQDFEDEALHTVKIFVENFGLSQDLLWEAVAVLHMDGIISQATFCKFKSTGTGAASIPNSSALPALTCKAKQQLHRLIVHEPHADDQEIIQWVDSNRKDKDEYGANLVMFLVKTVCRFASEKDDTGLLIFYPERIGKRKKLLLNYINGRTDLGAEALSSVQSYIEKNKHSPGLLRLAFEVLYGSGIVSKDAFFRWETSIAKEDISEESLKQTVPFFTWLLTN